MPKKLPQEKIDLIKELYIPGQTNLTALSKEVGVPYTTVYAYTRAPELGFPTWADYLRHLAVENGFKSLKEYQTYCATHQGEHPVRNHTFPRTASSTIDDVVQPEARPV